MAQSNNFRCLPHAQVRRYCVDRQDRRLWQNNTRTYNIQRVVIANNWGRIAKMWDWSRGHRALKWQAASQRWPHSSVLPQRAAHCQRRAAHRRICGFDLPQKHAQSTILTHGGHGLEGTQPERMQILQMGVKVRGEYEGRRECVLSSRECRLVESTRMAVENAELAAVRLDWPSARFAAAVRQEPRVERRVCEFAAETLIAR